MPLRFGAAGKTALQGEDENHHSDVITPSLSGEHTRLDVKASMGGTPGDVLLQLFESGVRVFIRFGSP